MIFDGLLVGLMWALAWHCTHSRSYFASVVAFIALGLLLALAWSRLYAPDVALAEAAIGAGLAGVLLLSTVRHLPETQCATRATPGWRHWLVWGLAGMLAGGLLWSALSISPPASVMAQQVQAHLSQTGVTHPVTAVLLNYRALDTALELAVLLWAWMAQRLLSEVAGPEYQGHSRVLSRVAQWLWPLVLMVAVYLLWRGSSGPGGAFQSGAVLAAGWVLLGLAQVSVWVNPWQQVRLSVRLGWLGGVTIFLWVGLLGLAQGVGFMGYVPEQAGTWILLIESLAALSIGLLLASMVFVHLPRSSGADLEGRA